MFGGVINTVACAPSAEANRRFAQKICAPTGISALWWEPSFTGRIGVVADEASSLRGVSCAPPCGAQRFQDDAAGEMSVSPKR